MLTAAKRITTARRCIIIIPAQNTSRAARSIIRMSIRRKAILRTMKHRQKYMLALVQMLLRKPRKRSTVVVPSVSMVDTFITWAKFMVSTLNTAPIVRSASLAAR